MNTSQPILVGLGESLFDCFEDREVLGGAPLNSAAVLHQLGAVYGFESRVVSRTGADDLGRRLREELAARGMTDRFVQTDPELPTGRVLVEMHEGEPEYEILRDVAWDRIAWDDRVAELAGRCRGVTFGTLAQRCDVSRRTISRFLDAARAAVRMLDVNLRQAFYSAEVLEASCRAASVVKLNRAELDVLGELLGFASEAGDPLEAFVARYGFDAVILTHGARGTELRTAAGRFTAPVPRYRPADGADPVGAGDACGAVCLAGFVLGWPDQQIVARANRIAAYVASQPGATPTIPEDVLRD